SVIHHGDIILVVLVAPVGVNRSAEFLAIAGGAPRIGKKNCIAVRGIKLGQVIKGSGVLPHRAAVWIQQRRDFLAGCVIERFVQIASNGGAVLALEVDVVGLKSKDGTAVAGYLYK